MLSVNRTIALFVCAALAAPVVVPFAQAQSLDAARSSIMRAYVERIPPGSRVRVTLLDGDRIRGTLMVLDGNDLVVRKRARIPEPPVRIALDRIADVELDHNGNSIGKAIAIGAGAGAAAALGVFFIILATLE